MKLLPPHLRLRLWVKSVKFRHAFWYGSRSERAVDRLVQTSRRKIAAFLTLVGVLVVVSIMLLSTSAPAGAVTVSLSRQDLVDGTSSYSNISLNNSQVQLQSGVVGQWNNSDGLGNLPNLNYGTPNLAYGPNSTIYLMSTLDSQCHFRKYDVERQLWFDLSVPPVGCGTGNILVYDQVGSFYYAPGNNIGRFFRYDITDNSWHEMAALPTTIGDLSAGQFVTSGSNQYVYVFRGLSSPALWRYTVGTNTWASEAAFPTTTNVNNGIEMTWDGANTIYALSNDVGEFRKYSISTNTWTNLTTVSQSCVRTGLQYASGVIYSIKLAWCSDVQTMTSYNVGTNAWSNLTPPPAPSTIYDWPPATTYDGSRYFYTMLGSEFRPQLYRYDTIAQSWGESGLMPSNTDTGAYHFKMIYDGANSAYYVGGVYTSNYDHVFKYDTTTKTPTRVGSQINTLSGLSGAYNGGFLYALPAPGNNTFQKYDTTLGTWTPLANLPVNSNNGADIVDGGNGFLYATFGTTATFYKYNLSTNVWTALTNAPYTEAQGGGITRIGTKIYMLVGAQTGYAATYDITAGTWSTIAAMPEGSVDWGGWITSDTARYLYIGTSQRTAPTAQKVYRYDTQTATWQRIADLPGPTVQYASAFYNTNNNELYVAQGEDSAHIWDWNPGTTNYVTTGTWFSKTYDFSQVQSWTSFNATIGGSGTTAIYTRTSSDKRIWSAWAAVSGAVINSPTNRYLQMKVVLTGTGTTTPTVSGLGVTYSQETSPPSLPSQLSALDSKGGQTTLTSGQTYKYRHPYFSWAASSDGAGGSGVAGYYVYYGTDSAGDPVASGNFQTNTDYTVSDPMTAGSIYYLRIAVKDNLGNTSSPATFFSYRYYYLSPPGSVVETSTADFTGGTNTNVSIANGSMSLVQQAGGAWSTGPMTMLPQNVTGPAEIVIGDYMYVARGASTTTFWQYNLVNQTWATLQPTPDTVNTGSSMAYDGHNYLYLMRGNGSNAFFRYDIQNNIWSTLGTLPENSQPGSDIKYLGGTSYAIMFTGVREFYFWDSSTGVFTPKSSYPTSTNNASGMWYDGNDTIYAYLGAWNWYNERSRPGLAKYSIANDTWKLLAYPPVTANTNQNNLVSDGQGNLYIFTNNTVDDLNRNQRAMKYNIATDTWSQLPGFNSQIIWGSMTSDNQRYIYILPSENTNDRKIVRYDTLLNIFTPTSAGVDSMDRIPWDAPTNAWQWVAGNASTMAYDGSKWVYAIGGAESPWSRFMKFDPKTGETQYLPPPLYVGVGDSLAYLNGSLYFEPGRSLSELYKYDDVNQQWLKMANMPSIAYRPGASGMVAYGGVLYVARGNSNSFYKYTPDAGIGTWATLANVPANIQNGSTVLDSTNGYIYVAAGNGTANFYRYNIAANTWLAMASLPATSSYGSAMVMNNGKIYATLGNYTVTSYIYDIASNTWANGVTAPDQFRYGSQMLNMGSYAIAMAGENAADFWQFNFPSATTAFNGLGVHVSQPQQIAGIFDYANITAQTTIPAGTSVEMYTRTSADGNAWDSWALASNVKNYTGTISGTVTSKVRKWIQIKLVLTSNDNVSAPVVGSYALNYYFDVTPPANPGTMTAFTDNTDATPVLANTWYNNASPDFDWPAPGDPGGANDGPLGSDIGGYWVYVGTDPNASPLTAGVFVTDTHYVPTLTTSGTYYVRIQTQDQAGNVQATAWAPFTYEFDNTPPTNPAIISVTPSGYTTKNNFSFVWPSSADADSGVAGYCYHTGASSGPFAAEQCQAGTSLDNISAAYTTGTNIFYLRSYDNAGNYSPSYTTVSFYYSTNPPGPVSNLHAIPPSSPQNLFAFTWDLPTLFSGDPDLLQYCYSVNSLPTPTNTTCSKDKFIAPFKAATQNGTNILYVAAKDEAGNIDWTSFAYTNFIANTVSPGIPLNLVGADTSDRATNRWSLTLTWGKPEFIGNGVKDYVVQRSDDDHVWTDVGSTSSLAFVDLNVTPNATYYYRVLAEDGVENRGGSSGEVALTAKGSFSAPPDIVVAPEVHADSNQASITWATSRPATSFVYFGTSPGQLTQSTGALDLATAHSMLLTGLQASTTYYYRVQSFDNDRSYQLNDAQSQIFSFQTTAAASVYAVTASGATLDSVVLTWQTTVPTKTVIQYGTSQQYGYSISDADSLSTGHTYSLTGLQAGTTYHFRFEATTELGSTIYSDDYTFVTKSRPVVSGVQFQSIDNEIDAAVTVVWHTNVPTSSTVKYSGLGANQEVSTSDLVSDHAVTIHNLAASTDYTFAVEGRDQYGYLAASSPQVWRSSVDTRPPTISNVSVSVSTVNGANGQTAQMIIMWNTDEPATSQVQYGLVSSNKMDKTTPLDTEMTTNHIVIISGLNLSDVYQIQFSSKDNAGNNAESTKTLVVTPDKEESVLDGMLNVLLKVFRF